MLAHAFGTGVPFAWVTADEGLRAGHLSASVPEERDASCVLDHRPALTGAETDQGHE